MVRIKRGATDLASNMAVFTERKRRAGRAEAGCLVFTGLARFPADSCFILSAGAGCVECFECRIPNPSTRAMADAKEVSAALAAKGGTARAAGHVPIHAPEPSPPVRSTPGPGGIGASADGRSSAAGEAVSKIGQGTKVGPGADGDSKMSVGSAVAVAGPGAAAPRLSGALDEYLAKAFKGDLLPVDAVKWLCATAAQVFSKEPNVVALNAPVTVVGDIHGQFFDLLELFAKAGRPPETRFLFLGDFVDRGARSVQVVTLLLCLKIRYPSCVTMIRGNHESRQISSVYGFFAECQKKFGGDMDVWKAFTQVFDSLPIAGLVESKVLALHGGLSPCVARLDQLRVLDRFGEVPDSGPLSDIMWSDPSASARGFVESDRGTGFLFGEDVLDRFLRVNGLSMVVRSHQLCQKGYLESFKGKLVTVWSAPNYCYRMGNKATFLRLDKDLKKSFVEFEASKENKAHALKVAAAGRR